MKIRLFSKQSPKSNAKPPLSPKRPQSKRSRARYRSRLRTFAVRSLSQKTSNDRKPLRPRIHHRLTQILSISIAAAITLSSTIGTVFAIDNATLEKYGTNGVYWYDATGGDDCLPITNGGNVTIIGDSITEGALKDLKELLPQAEIYAKYSKTFGSMDDPAEGPSESKNPSGVSILKWLLNDNKLQNTVVYALGTNNNPLRQSQMDVVLDLIGPNRTVFFLTNYNFKDPSTYDTNNNIFRSAAELANVQLIDWQTEASKDPNKYMNMSDSLGVHLSSGGNKLWAELISKAVGGTGSLTAGGNGNYTNYAGDKVLTETQIEQLEANIPIYNQAIAETGAGEYRITWYLIAAIHYKETGLSRYNPKNGQGVYQLYSYTGGGKNRNAFPAASSISADEFLRQTKIMLKEDLIPKVIGGLNLGNDEDIKSLFFGYNGRSSRYIDKALAMGFNKEQANSGEGSPYVMNRYDAQRDPNSSEMNPNWPGMYVADGEYSPTATTQTFGGYTVYKAIGGASACGTNTIASGGLNLEQARKLIDDYIDNVKCSDYGGIACMSGCLTKPLPTKNNCVTFVKYFLQRFSDFPPGQTTGDGKNVVRNLTTTFASYGFTYGGNKPRPFSIFSISSGNYGHTGVVLGVDEANDKVVIGQMGCSMSSFDRSWSAKEYNLSTFTSGAYTFAYTDEVIDLNKLSEAIK